MTSGNPIGNQDQRPQGVGGDDPIVIIDDLEGRSVRPHELEPYALKRFYTVKEAATYLATSKWAVYKLLQRGILAGYHDGRRVKIDRADLDRFVALRMRPYEAKSA